jgi:hypothetical protein
VFARELREHFAGRDAHVRLLDAMVNGIEVLPGIEVRPPRFRYIRDPAAVHSVAGLRWASLDPALPRRPEDLASGLLAAAARILDGASAALRRAAADVIGRVERGDFRPIDNFARGLGRPGDDAFETALRGALADVSEEKPPEELF